MKQWKQQKKKKFKMKQQEIKVLILYYKRERKFFNSHLFWLNSHPWKDASVGSVVNQGTTRELARRNN
jgi:hypothetical protein